MAVPVLLFLGAVTTDLTPLAIHLSLLISDVALIAAGILAAVLVPMQTAPTALARSFRNNRLIATSAILGIAFLLGIGLSTLIAGAPRSGVETWLLFALLIGFVAPFTAVAIARHRHGLRAVTIGLFFGGILGSIGFVAEALYKGEAVLYGLRTDGIFDSDQVFLILTAVAIALTHVAHSLAQRGLAALVSPVIVVEMASLPLFIAALTISRNRSAWVAVVLLSVLAVGVATRSVWMTALMALVVAVAVIGVYRFEVLPQPLMNRIDQTFEGSSDLDARRATAAQLLRAWQERPWGLGLNESWRYVEPDLAVGSPSLHNVAGHALVEGGPVAALALLAAPLILTALWFRASWRPSTRNSRWLVLWPISAFWAIYIAAQFSPSLYEHAAWIVIGVLIGVAARQDRE